MNDSPTVLVHAKGLRKDYGSGEGLVRALDMVDLDVNRGEAVAVMGPSGCGKSTLLHLIGGLDRPSAGQLSVVGQRLDELSERALAHWRRDEIGFVFQAFQLMDELTAQENVELPALLAGYSPNEARARAPQHYSNRSTSPIAPGTFPRCCPGVNVSASRSREHS
jgi:putative ABC transport system ATP-binding protein